MEKTKPWPTRHYDGLDDVTPRKGMPWKSFNEFFRSIRDHAVIAGRPVPGRHHLLATMLEWCKELSVEDTKLLADKTIARREADDLRRKGTRKRGLVAKYRMGPR